MYSDAVVYHDSCRTTAQMEFQTLAPFKRVSTGIIDTWCSYLNAMEKSKAPETISRLFFSSRPCLESMVDARPESTEKFQYDTFWTRLMDEAIGSGIYQWDKYDMFFFPVCGTDHQYLICFDLQDSKMNIIDHTLADTHDTFGEKYGNTPSLLKKFFAASLTKSKVPKMAAQVRQCNAHVVTMPWRNNHVINDMGVYVMRHMETYFGEREKDWECGLSAKGTKSLEMLRMKFTTALLTTPHNSKSGTNQTQATKAWIKKPAKFSFERWVENYGIE